MGGARVDQRRRTGLSLKTFFRKDTADESECSERGFDPVSKAEICGDFRRLSGACVRDFDCRCSLRNTSADQLSALLPELVPLAALVFDQPLDSRFRRGRELFCSGEKGPAFSFRGSSGLPALVYRLTCLFKTVHYSVFRPYIYAPLTEFFSSGTVTGRLFIVPGAGIALIAAVFFFRRAVRRNKDSDSPLGESCENGQHENRQNARNNT